MILRRVVVTSLAIASFSAPLAARAANVQACLAASEKGQRARTSGKLREARDQFLVCGAEGCPALVRHDCIQWQSELVNVLPSVVVGARDNHGRDLIDVTVTMDGEVLTTKLDGKSLTVDPGAHSFKFEHANFPPVLLEQTLVKEGEKSRPLNVVFNDGTPSSPVATGTPDGDRGQSQSQTEARGHTVLPWVVVGVGAATLITGAVIFATAPSRPENCDESTTLCTRLPGQSDADFNDQKDKAGKADAQPTLGAVVGGAGLALVVGGLIWHFVEPTGPSQEKEKATALRVSPWAMPGSSGVTLGGRF